MQRNVLAALAGIIVLLGGVVWFMRSGTHTSARDANEPEIAAARGESASAMQRGAPGAPAQGNRTTDQRSAARSQGESAAGAAERSGATGMRDRLAQARRIGDGGRIAIPGEAVESEGSFEVATGGESESELQGLQPESTPGTHRDTGGDDTATQSGEAGSVEESTEIPGTLYQSEPQAEFSSEEQVELPEFGEINPKAGSVSFWVKPDWQPDDESDATFVQLGNTGLHVVKNVSFIRFEYLDESGVERGIGFPIREWKPGEYHQVTAVWNGNQLMIYADGQMQSQSTFDQPPSFDNVKKAYAGSNVAPGVASPATITGLSLHSWAMGPSDVATVMQQSDPRTR